MVVAAGASVVLTGASVVVAGAGVVGSSVEASSTSWWGRCRASISSYCRQCTGISVRQLVKSMVEATMCWKAVYRHQCQAAGQQHGNGVMCEKTVYSPNTSDCCRASEYNRQIRRDGPEALL